MLKEYASMLLFMGLTHLFICSKTLLDFSLARSWRLIFWLLDGCFSLLWGPFTSTDEESDAQTPLIWIIAFDCLDSTTEAILVWRQTGPTLLTTLAERERESAFTLTLQGCVPPLHGTMVTSLFPQENSGFPLRVWRTNDCLHPCESAGALHRRSRKGQRSSF